MKKILIIDDSSLSRRLMRKILEGAGHTVIEAQDGLSGIESFMMETPDLVFLDLTMPEINGIEVMNQILGINPSAKIIIATADIQTSTKELSVTQGAAAFINKPFVAEDIIKAINSIH